MCLQWSFCSQEAAKQFAKDIVDAAHGKEYNKGAWTCGDVFDGTHEGGSANPIAGGAAAVRAAKTRESDTRKKGVMTFFIKHIVVHPLATDTKSCGDPSPEEIGLR